MRRMPSGTDSGPNVGAAGFLTTGIAFRALVLTLVGAALALATWGTGAARAETTVQLNETQERQLLYADEVVSELTSPEAAEAGLGGTLRLLEVELIARAGEIQSEPISEAEAEEIRSLLSSVHAEASGESLSASISDLNGLVAQLGLAQTGLGHTKHVLQLAARDLGRKLLEEADNTGSHPFDPYVLHHLWWGNVAGTDSDPYAALETVFSTAQGHTAIETMLASVTTSATPSAGSSLGSMISKIPGGAAGEGLKKLLEKVKAGTPASEVGSTAATAEGDMDEDAEAADKLWTNSGSVAGLKKIGAAIAISAETRAYASLVDKAAGVLTTVETTAALAANKLVQGAASLASLAVEGLTSLADPAMAVTLVANAPAIIGQIVSMFGGGSSESRVLEQLVDIEKMIESLSKQVHSELANVDENLQALAGTLQRDTEEIGATKHELGEVSGKLSHIEERINQLQADLYNVASTQREEAFNTALNTFLGYTALNGKAMSQAQFNEAAGEFYTFSSSDSLDSISEDPQSNWPKEPSAIAGLLGEGESTNSLDFNLTYLGSFADENKWGDGLEIARSFPTGMPNPTVWAAGADAFAQLLLENPGDLTETRLQSLSQLEDVGAPLLPALRAVGQRGSGYTGTLFKMPELEVPVATDSSVINHAVTNYLEAGVSLLRRFEAEEHDFLSEKDPGVEAKSQCSECSLATAPNRNVPGDTGHARIELWGGSEQAPNTALTPFQTATREEGGTLGVGHINTCDAEEEEFGENNNNGPRLKWNPTQYPQSSPAPVTLSAEVEGHANPLLDPPLPHVYANAWHLGLGYLTACYSAASHLETLEYGFRAQIEWLWHDSVTKTTRLALLLGIQEPYHGANNCQSSDADRRLQDLWTQATAEASGCARAGQVYYEQEFAHALSHLLDEPQWGGNPHGRFDLCDGGEGEVLEQCLTNENESLSSSNPEFLEFNQVGGDVTDDLKQLREETYADLTGNTNNNEDRELNAGKEDVREAATVLNGARALVNSYVELALPRSFGSGELGKLLFGPEHLLDNSPGAYELYKYLDGGVQKEEQEAEEHHETFSDPAGDFGKLEVLLSSGAQQLAAELPPLLAAAPQVDEAEQVIPATLGRLHLTEFVLGNVEPLLTEPQVEVSSPTARAYETGSNVPMNFKCTPAGEVPLEKCEGEIVRPNGTRLTGVQPGQNVQFTETGSAEAIFTVRDKDGRETSQTIKFTVAEAPTITLRAPVEGGEYMLEEGPTVEYECHAPSGTSVSYCGAVYEPAPNSHLLFPISTGEELDVFTNDQFPFVVEARDADGLTKTIEIHYRGVNPLPPVVAIDTPADGAHYTLGAQIAASYQCSGALPGAHLKPGTEGCEGPVADGAAIDTTSLGSHSFTVTARQRDGITENKTVHYNVEPVEPAVTQLSPAFGPTTGGTPVTITGSRFHNVTGVRFGSEPAKFEVKSETTILAIAPAGSVGSVDVTVTTDEGVSARVPADQFTYHEAHGPTEHLPELGRCVKLAKRTGVFANAGCTSRTENETSGGYEWLQGPGPQPTFLFRNRRAVLSTAGRALITCSENTYAGEFLGTQTISLHLSLSGCEPVSHLGIKCETAGAAAGEVDLNTLEGHLGYVAQGPKPAVGLALTAAGGLLDVAVLRCGEVPITLTGGVIASYSKVDAMAPLFRVALTRRHGRQFPESLEGQTSDLLQLTSGEGAPEAAFLVASDRSTNREWLEIKAIP